MPTDFLPLSASIPISLCHSLASTTPQFFFYQHVKIIYYMYLPILVIALKKKADAVWTCKFSGEFYTIHGGKYYLKSFHIKQKLSPGWVIYYGQILLSVCVKEMPLTAHEPGTNPSQKISLNEIGAGKLDRPEITLLLLFANSCHMWISWFPPPILHPNKSIISQEVP